MIIDATNLVVGRLGAVVAKKALLGEKIDIVNAQAAVVTGKKATVLGKFKQRVDRKSWSKGPHYLRSPDMLLKRMIRNMLPYKRPRGIVAYKNIMCWQGVPEEFKDKKAETLVEADVTKLQSYDYVSVKEISRFLGGNID